MMSIQTNVNALSAQRGLGVASGRLQDAMAKLSSGYRINKAADDAAGLAISEKMKAQISGLNQAMRNSMDAVSLVQTADGALGEITGMVQRMRVLAVQSATDVNTAEDRVAIQTEVSALQNEITRLATATDFNGINLLDGSFQNKTFQVGAFRNQTVDVSVADARSTALGAFKHQATGTDFGAVAPAVTVPASAVDGDTVTISGKNGSAQVVFAAGDTALDQAAAVNAATGATGVKATAVTFAELHTLGAVGTISFNLNSTAQGTANDGTAQAIQAVITNTSDLSALRDAINGHSASTGITAELRTGNASAVILTQAQGRDIEFDTFVNSDAGADAITYRALQSDKTTALGANRTTTTAASLDSGRISGALDFISTDQYNLTSATTEIIATTVVSVNTLGAAGSLGGQSVATQGGAAGAIEVIDSALEKLNDMRAQLGASQNRFETTAAALESSAENLSAANSRIRDTDIATESAEMARAQVLSQAGVSVLAQANQLPQMALKLLG